MKNKLSIIIPCYNCAATLKEAVDSVFTQNFTIPFEIVMVDDKSTDNTMSVMQELADVHSVIKLYYHKKNMGGGAARNTGIKFSQGDLIFCLDSDNLFFPDTMQRMIDYLVEKDCDGVVIHERRYFKEKDQDDFKSHINTILNKPIKFENLFDDSGVVLDNFIFKKEAFLKTIGYPEKHGFDTQCFEVRFLAAGNTTYVCPNTIFLHRQSLNSKGYFHRVYEEGMFSVNFYLIYEEIIYLFSQESIQNIMMYDIFSQNKLGKNNIKTFFEDRYKKIGKAILRDNFEVFLVSNGAKKYNEYLKTNKITADKFVEAVSLFHENKYLESSDLYQQLFKEYPKSKVIKYNIARCELALEGRFAESATEIDAIKKSGYTLTTRKMSLDAGPLKVFLVKIKKSLGL